MTETAREILERENARADAVREMIQSAEMGLSQNFHGIQRPFIRSLENAAEKVQLFGVKAVAGGQAFPDHAAEFEAVAHNRAVDHEDPRIVTAD